MTNPSPTLARIQAEHPELVCKKPDGSTELADGIVPHRLLVAAVTYQDRQLADLEAENARLREQLAETEEALIESWEAGRGGQVGVNVYSRYRLAIARQEQRRKERE